MADIYFAGLKGNKIGNKNQLMLSSKTILAIDQFTSIKYEGLTDVEIGWDYFLVWKDIELFISGKIVGIHGHTLDKLLQIPEHKNIKFKQAIAGIANVTVLTHTHDIWIYKIYDDLWTKVTDFVNKNTEEYVIKINQGRCTVALTNSGRFFNIPLLINNPDSIKFVDMACGFDHTILLTSNGDVYSMGIGTRGQLGHGDLEDCDEPNLIEALAGLKVVQISAAGWHSAVVTNQGDLYTWGANNQGQLGLPNIQSVIGVPTIVDFKNENQEIVELNINKVQCGNAFTICMTDTNDLWGCGSNKYGQLGLNRKDIPDVKEFILITPSNINKPIKDFKCRESATCIYTE